MSGSQFGMVTTPPPPDAIPNDTRVRKVHSEKGDGHKNGALGTVVGYLGHPEVEEYGYWIRWDDFPLPVFTLSYKVEPVPQEATT